MRSRAVEHEGVSMRGGAKASLTAADVFPATPGLSPLFTLVDGCGRTLGVIRWTSVASSRHHAAVAAMSNHMPPIVAALVMPLNSLTAVSILRGIEVLQERAMSALAIVLWLALALAAVAIRGCVWAIRSGPYDDTETPPPGMVKDD